MSANNFITSKHAKHGISHAFSYSHRFIRLNEMIEEVIKERKINRADFVRMQTDTLDIQVRESLKYMTAIVKRSKESVVNLLFKDLS